MKKKEKEILQLNAEQENKNFKVLIKNQNLMFSNELKNKRLAKIKSKLYHKIKKRKDQKLKAKECKFLKIS